MGNCQLATVGWFIKMMNSSVQICWCCNRSFIDNMVDQVNIPVNFLKRRDHAINNLKNCNCLIYHPFSGEKEWATPANAINATDKIKVSWVYYNPDKHNESLDLMKEKEKVHNVDIKSSEILQKIYDQYGRITTHNGPRHLSFIYYERLTKIICNRVGLFYDQPFMNYIESTGAPHAQPVNRKIYVHRSIDNFLY